jgi:PTH1 family peptidyl-tRNA hydrolase
LVVGLGNPGADFAGTRHNVGADTVALLSERHEGDLRSEKGLRSLATTVELGGRRVLLAVPLTYMNDSGLAVAPLARRAGIPPDSLGGRLVVIHDELDLPPGRIRVKAGGGTAGNNGLNSVVAHLHTKDFLRVRIGIGKPPGRQAGADYVLRRPGKADRELLDLAVVQAADAVEAIVCDGAEAAMTRFNAA